MPRSGHVDRLAHGSDLAGRVGYRLGGITPDKSASRLAQERQVDYRLGAHVVDSRRVWFLGAGATADLLGYRPGEQLGPRDGRIVREAMFGIDRETGQRTRVKTERNRHARIAAAPYFAVLVEACEDATIDVDSLFSGRNLRAQLRSLTKAGLRPTGTVALGTAEAILRSNEHAWLAYYRAGVNGLTVEPPRILLDRGEVMRRLGGHYRASAGGQSIAPVGDSRTYATFDLSLDDQALGGAIWDDVAASAAQKIIVGNAGYEMTVTCPKSLSVAAFLAPAERREQWLDLIHEATRDAVDELMRRVAHGRTGHEGDGQSAMRIRGLGYAATVSVEAHSRELDPHLHGHVMIPNRLLCEDGVERTLATGGADLINHAWWLQAQFERRLRMLSVEWGLVDSWEFDLGNAQWEVTGADPQVMAFYSQGHSLVAAAVRDALAGDSPAVDKHRLRMLDSRAKRKVTGRKGDQVLSWGEIADRMRQRADAADIDLAEAFAMAPFDPATQPQQWDVDIWARTVEQIVCENKAAEISARIEAAVRCFAPHDVDDAALADIVRLVKAREFTTGGRRARGSVGATQLASNRVADAEKRAWAAFISGLDANPHRLSTKQADRHLATWRSRAGWTAQDKDFTDGQRALFWQMTTGTDRVATVIGAAGSGKTTAVDAARFALASQGKRVFGICVAAIAAQALRDTAKVQAGTVTWLTTRIDFARNPLHPARSEADSLARSRSARDRKRAAAIGRRYAIPDMDHLVIDEASMIPATDLATVLEWTAERNVTVTLIGDTRQLQPVGPSGMFPMLHAARPGAELVENLRQQTDVGRECAAFLRDGNAEAALFRLADTGQLVVATSQTEAEHLLVAAWAERAAQAATAAERISATALESDRNDQVDILNALARREARGRGWLSGPDTTYTAGGKRVDYACGDHLMVTRNIKREDRTVLANGTRAVVLAVDPDGVDIASWDPRGEYRDRLTFAQAATCSRHGYAMTTHKLQGQTLGSLVVDVGPDRDLSSTYVALTRHRDDVLAVVNIADILDATDLENLMSASPEARRDAVIVEVARTIQRKGFAEQPTAHEIIGVPVSARIDVSTGIG